jgi:hypothetical protein
MQHSTPLRSIAPFAFVLLCAGLAPPAASSQEDGAPTVVMLKLRDGSVHWGQIEEHAPEQLAFRRMDTGGLARLTWGFLDPGQERELRERFGYVDLDGEEIFAEAARIVMIDGQERIGLILGRTATALIVKDASTQIELPLARVRTVQADLRVPARDIYTRAELYNQQLARTDLDDAASLYELAVYCERILEFQRAVEHYARVVALEPGFRADELSFARARAALKAEQQEQLEALDNADRLRRRKAFDQARILLTDFQAAYPGSPLQSDRARLEARVEKDRTAVLSEEVRRRWLARMERSADALGRKSFAEVLAFLEQGFSKEVARGVVGDVRVYKSAITEDEARQLWLERRKSRWRPASYGAATWLLGEDAALKGGPGKSEQAQPRTALERERAELAERVRRFLQNQSAAQRSASSTQGEEVNREEFWASLSTAARKNWIIAHYAENAGDLEVRPEPELQNCPGCAGTGTREIIHTGGTGANNQAGIRKVTCQTCQGIGSLRRIRYR